jgi:hypothetical protein
MNFGKGFLSGTMVIFESSIPIYDIEEAIEEAQKLNLEGIDLVPSIEEQLRTHRYVRIGYTSTEEYFLMIR